MGNQTHIYANTQKLTYPGPVEIRRAREVVNDLLASSEPCHALAKLAERSESDELEAFERYASIVLADAGASALSSITRNRTIFLEPPGDGQLARFVSKKPLYATTKALLGRVEDALNRLVGLCDALEDAREAAPTDSRIRISWMGVSHASKQPTWRSTHVELPALVGAAQPGIAYYNEVDWRVLDNVASSGRAVFQNSIKPNMRQSLLGAAAPAGSDWDVRTRMAALLGRLELSLGFSFRYDCDVEHGKVEVVFSTPPCASFPLRVATPDLSTLEPLGNRADSARLAYALRLSCLVACACFGSGHHLETALVTAESETGEALVTCDFDRYSFVRSALAALDSKELASPSLRFDPDGIVKLIAPRRIELNNTLGKTTKWPAVPSIAVAGDAEAHKANALEAPEARHRVEPWIDERKLPKALRELFGAKRVCDLDTRHYVGGFADAIDAANADSEESVIAAIAHLENVIEQIDVAPPDDDAASRALYCDNPFSRIAVPLVIDELSVGNLAQHFLDGEAGSGQAVSMPTFFRAPDALFHAHMGLADLYQRLGDFTGAASHADICISLAPTTASAYFRKADILAQQTRNIEALNVLTAGLRCAISRRDCALLYYHLALLLWKTGHKSEAAAVQVYTATLDGEFAEKARIVVKSLRARRDSTIIVHASPLAATREMARARIPIAPGEEARALIARAAVGLSCANAPEAAAPYAAELAGYLSGDRIVSTACHSIQYGLKKH